MGKRSKPYILSVEVIIMRNKRLGKINTFEVNTHNNNSKLLGSGWCNGVCSCYCTCFGGTKVMKAASGWGNNAVVNAAKSITC
jgi:hypothetical protein